MPVSTLLGGQHRDKIKPYATGLYFKNYEDPSSEFEEEVERYIEQGFKAIKMKVGLGVDKDYDNIKKVRSFIGEDIELMIDSNHAL